eukprot:764388-Hanusia_phi.AAC.3
MRLMNDSILQESADLANQKSDLEAMTQQLQREIDKRSDESMQANAVLQEKISLLICDLRTTKGSSFIECLSAITSTAACHMGGRCPQLEMRLDDTTSFRTLQEASDTNHGETIFIIPEGVISRAAEGRAEGYAERNGTRHTTRAVQGFNEGHATRAVQGFDQRHATRAVQGFNQRDATRGAVVCRGGDL